MRIFYSPDHRMQLGRAELTDGRLVPVYDRPERIEAVLEELARRRFPVPEAPVEIADDLLATVHDPRYLDFLRSLQPRVAGIRDLRNARARPHAVRVRLGLRGAALC